jgi:hypothetical protein
MSSMHSLLHTELASTLAFERRNTIRATREPRRRFAMVRLTRLAPRAA